MRSKKVEFRMPWVLYEMGHTRCTAQGFRSMARYLIDVTLRDILQERRQNFTKAIANSDPDEQDWLIQHIKDSPVDGQKMIDWLMSVKQK